jgi:Family of unknown function (DUF5681)
MSKSIGYCNPPKATQFKKGKSGNPGGRPKGSHSIQSLFAKHLGRRIPVKINGISTTMEQREAIVTRIIEQAKAGDGNAIKIVMVADNVIAEKNASHEHIIPPEQKASIMANLGLIPPKNKAKQK